jgi:opacity protein-like surface antigen
MENKMKNANVSLAALIGALCLSTPATAQEWSFGATIYAWLNDTDLAVDTPLGEVDGSLSFSDALDNLDMAFMGNFEANYGRWSFVTDVVYTDLSTDGSTPVGIAFTDIGVGSKMTIVTAIGAYRFVETPNVSIDLGGGLRYIELENKVSFSGGAAPATSSKTTTDWTDAILAARFTFPINDRTAARLFVDYGGFGGDTSSWQAFAGIGYRVSDNVILEAGYRYLNFEKDAGANQTTVDLSGPAFGLTYRF